MSRNSRKYKDGATVEEHLAYLNDLIENYVPATKWEAANGRTLRRLIAKRNRLEKVVENGDTKEHTDDRV